MFKLFCKLLVVAAVAWPLAGCESTRIRRDACKAGDWSVIGHKDGAEGMVPRFDEQRSFCADVDGAAIGADAASQYQAGWGRGNALFWQRLGEADGRAGMAPTQFDARAAMQTEVPPSRAAYQQGWAAGNGAYWLAIGAQDGEAGRPAGDGQARAAAAQHIGFNAASYRQGWTNGNYAYWGKIGRQDAADGQPERELEVRAGRAKANGVQVREDAYKAAWNSEIVEYWRRLGVLDATDGRDVHMRRADAKARGLPFHEAAYLQQWEQRLADHWRAAGTQDGYGHPYLLDRRIASAARDKVFVIARTRELYDQAWSAKNAEYCRVDNAFEFGRRGTPMAVEVCRGPDQNRAQRAWIGGQDFEALGLRLARTQHDLERALERRDGAVRGARRIEGEIRRDADDKNRVANAETAKAERRREHELAELRDSAHRLGQRVDELRGWEFRYTQQMQQIRRDIYRD